MSNTVLVTGGAGYIGSHTCKALKANGFIPIVYDNLSTGFKELVQWGELIEGDVLDTAKLVNVLQLHQPVGVIHFAGSIAVGESVQKPGMYYHNNISGFISLLEAMRKSNVANIVMSGTCAIYGEPESIPISEDSRVRPLNPYAVSKAVMEQMLSDYELAHKFSTASLRYFNAAGADPEGRSGECHQPETHLIPLIFMAAEGEIPALQLFGDDYNTPDGTCLRDYIHVDDLASAHILALQALMQGQRNMRLNLGTGTGYSVKEMIQLAEKIIGKKVPYSIAPRRAGDSPALVADNSLIRQTLGWEPKHSSLEHILKTAWEWFQKDTPRRKSIHK